MSSLNDFHSVIPLGSYLKSVEGGFALAFSESFTTGQVFLKKDTEIDAIHPKLALGLHRLASTEHVVSSKLAAEAFIIWTCPICLPDAWGRKVAVCGVNNIVASIHSLQIDGFSIPFHELSADHGGDTFKIPTGRRLSQVVVPAQWLNDKHPGWRERLAIAEDIGMGPLEALHACLLEQSVVQPALPPQDLAL